MTRAASRILVQGVDVVARFYRLAVHREEHVAGTYAGLACRRAGIDLCRHDPRRTLHPQDAVFDVVVRGALHDVHESGHQQRRRDHDGQGRARPLAPLGGRRQRCGYGQLGHRGVSAAGWCKGHTTIRKGEAWTKPYDSIVYERRPRIRRIPVPSHWRNTPISGRTRVRAWARGRSEANLEPADDPLRRPDHEELVVNRAIVDRGTEQAAHTEQELPVALHAVHERQALPQLHVEAAVGALQRHGIAGETRVQAIEDVELAWRSAVPPPRASS